MKRIYSYVFAAVAMFAAVSCQKENAIDAPEVNEEAFAITAVANADTKTALVDGVKTYWTSTDALTVFDATASNRKFTTDITENSASAKFTTSTFELPENLETAMLLAVYPYTEGATTDFSTAITGLELPATQQAVAGGFDSDATIAFALGGLADQHNLKFNNVYGLFEFVVNEDNVKEVAIRANGGEKIAGPVSLALNGTLVAAEGAVSEVTLEGDFVKGSTYYVALIPGTYASGITVSFDGEEVKSTSNEVVLEKNQIRGMGELSAPKYVYLKPSLVWNIASPRYAVYFFGEGVGNNTWVDMHDTDDDGIYKAQMPEGDYTTLIYCRMNPSEEANNWDNKWSQTSNLSIPSNDENAYIIKPLTWDNGDGTWKTLSEAKSYKENTVYLKPGSVWNEASPRFAIYLCNGTSSATWKSMTKLNDDYYGVELPSDFTSEKYKNIIFCRMNPNNSTNDWNNKWSQTGDLATTQMTISQNYCCKISGNRDNPTVTWSTKLD